MKIARIALALFLALFAPAAAAQEEPQTFTSLAGPWWLTIGGKDKGAVLLQFTAPEGAVFEVEDVEITGNPSFGFSRALASFFQIEAGETLSLNSQRIISGELALSDPDGGGTISVLVVEKGKVNKTFTKLSLKGTIEGDEGPVVVKLKGSRPPSGFPVLSGRTTEGSLKGKDVKSKALDLSVQGDGVLGLPAYAFTAAGPAEIDKEEFPDVALEGRVMLTPSFKALGLLEDSSDFGDGLAKGKLSVSDPNTAIPKVGLVLEADPKLKLKGLLSEAVEPILLVTPTSFAFPATRLGEVATHTFTVQNVGTGTLSGTAEFLSGSSTDFAITGEDSYDELESGDPPFEIEVTFSPETAAAKTASLRFGVDTGAGSVVVPLTGTGGVSELTVEPDPIVFDDVNLGDVTAKFLDVTVTNDGDSTLTGQASIGTSLVFVLMDGLLPAVLPIGLNIAPGADQVLRVRFTPPNTPINSTATLTLTGPTAGNKTVSISGEVVTP